MTEPRVGLLGVGRWGRHHLRLLDQLGVLVAAYDEDVAVRRERPDVRWASDADALLDPGLLDAVVIATPAHTHAALAGVALARGLDVLVEKPLTLEAASAVALADRAAALGRVLMVGHLTLYHPAIEAMFALVRNGAIGGLRYAYSNRLNLGTVRDTEDILWSFAPHDVAVLLELFGSAPLAISATGGSFLRAGRADVTVTHLEFPRGRLAHIFVSWLHPLKEHRFVVIGEDAMISFRDGPEGGTLEMSPLALDEDGRALEPGGIATPVPFPYEEPLRREVQHFLDCVRERREPLTNGPHGIAVLRVLTAAARSLSEGGRPLRGSDLEETR